MNDLMASRVSFGDSIGSMCPALAIVVVSALSNSANSKPNRSGVFLSSVARITLDGTSIFLAQFMPFLYSVQATRSSARGLLAIICRPIPIGCIPGTALLPDCDLEPNPHFNNISAASIGVFLATSTRVSLTGIDAAVATAVNVLSFDPKALDASNATRNP